MAGRTDGSAAAARERHTGSGSSETRHDDEPDDKDHHGEDEEDGDQRVSIRMWKSMLETFTTPSPRYTDARAGKSEEETSQCRDAEHREERNAVRVQSRR